MIGILVCVFGWSMQAQAVDDGFGAGQVEETRYFTLYLAPALDAVTLARTLDLGPADAIIADKPLADASSLSQSIDILFTEACEILDVPMYTFHGTIKVCKDKKQLDGVFDSLFHRPLHTVSFYIHELNTIYISEENFTAYVLGHEIAHSVTSSYFVTPIPEKVSEVLAGYVEYQLRKKRK